MIPWVDVLVRDAETDNGSRVIHSYPFPGVSITNKTILDLKEAFTKLEDHMKQHCYETRLHFIMNLWHRNNFLTVSIKEWKYDT